MSDESSNRTRYLRVMVSYRTAADKILSDVIRNSVRADFDPVVNDAPETLPSRSPPHPGP